MKTLPHLDRQTPLPATPRPAARTAVRRRPFAAALIVALLATTVACGGGGAPDAGEAPPPVVNQAPLADAGAAQSVRVGAAVALDGRASTDANGDPLTYLWTLTARPPGSAAALAGATSAAPTFTADAAGPYVATLVVNDGRLNSAAATVVVTAAQANAAPVARAGSDQNVVTGTRVVLSGAASSDADGDALGYLWTLTARPAGSAAVLAGAESAAPVFTADVAGRYVATLVVDDGQQRSAAATVTVTAAPAALAATVTPTIADFGTVPIGSASTRIFTLRNTGNGTLSFAPGSPATDGGVWSLGGRSCTGTLAAGASCTVEVRFTPNSAQVYTGGVEFLFNEIPTGQGSPRAGLTGTGAGPVTLSASASPALADFGLVPIGLRAARVFTIHNNGSDTLSFKPGYPTTDGGVWSIGGRSCLGTLAPGARCTVTVNFDPNNAQTYTGAVYFYFNELQVGQGNPIASVTGIGTGPVSLGASLTPLAADFGDMPIGVRSERVFTITNTGNGPLSFRPGSPGTDGGVWSLRGGSCAGTLPVGASCMTTVDFTPGNTQAYSGSFHVHFNELPLGQGSLQAELAGRGG
jgi:hypothetical protein